MKPNQWTSRGDIEPLGNVRCRRIRHNNRSKKAKEVAGHEASKDGWFPDGIKGRLVKAIPTKVEGRTNTKNHRCLQE